MFSIRDFTSKIFLICFLFSLVSLAMHQAKAINVAATVPINCEESSKLNTEFNQHFLELMKNWQIPGASIAVMKDNKLSLSCGYGWSNLEERKPMQPNSLFRLGSVSKTITAIAILKLVEQNKLSLDDKVFTLLPDLKPLNKAKPNNEIYQITVRNLLQMSSGWYSDRPEDYEPMFGPWSNEMLKQLKYQVPPDCEMAARLMMSIPLGFSPGTKFSYSNLNYCLLGLVVNKFSKQSGATGYEQFIKQTLLHPLGINDMQLGSTKFEKKLSKEVKYYANDSNIFNDVDRTLDGLPYSSTDILKKNFSDGGWVASSRDLVKIMQALHNNQILNIKIKNIMTEKPSYSIESPSYPAIGWDEVKFVNGKRYTSKIGSFTGTKAFILQCDDGVSYAVLFNTKPLHGDQFIKELRETLALINA